MQFAKRNLVLASLLLLSSCAVYAEDVPVVDATADEGSTTIVESSSNNTSSLSIEQRVKKLEKQQAARSEVDLLSQVQQLQQQVQELRGQLEQQTHDIKQMQEQQRAQYQDIDQRLAKSGKAATADASAVTTSSSNKSTPSSTTTTTTSSTGVVSATDAVMNLPDGVNAGNKNGSDLVQEEKAYQTAYDLLRAKKYNEAKVALQKFVKKYPNSSYSVNAHYWLGELNLLQNHPDAAISEFNKVLKGNPTKSKLADATLKIGFAYYDKGEWAQARTQLQSVTQDYPGTTAAQMATARLQQMKQEGH